MEGRGRPRKIGVGKPVEAGGKEAALRKTLSLEDLT